MELPDMSSPPKSATTPTQRSWEDASATSTEMLPAHGDASDVADQRSISSSETAPSIPSPVAPQPPTQIDTLSCEQDACLPITTSRTTPESKRVSSASTPKTIVPPLLQLTSPSGTTTVLSEVALPTGSLATQESVSSVSTSKTVVPPILQVTSPSGRITVLFPEGPLPSENPETIPDFNVLLETVLEGDVAEAASAPCVPGSMTSFRSVPSTGAFVQSGNLVQSPAASTQSRAPCSPPELGPHSVSPTQLRHPDKESITRNKAFADPGEGNSLAGVSFEDISPAQSSFSSPEKSLADSATHPTVGIQEENQGTESATRCFSDDALQPWVPFLLLQTVTQSAILQTNSNSSELQTERRKETLFDDSPPTCLPPPLQPHTAQPSDNSNRPMSLPIANTSPSVQSECQRTTLTETSETETKTEIPFDDSPPFWLPQPLLPRTATQTTALQGTSSDAGKLPSPNAVSEPLATFHLPSPETTVTDEMKKLSLDDSPPSSKSLERSAEATETRSVSGSVIGVLLHEGIAMARAQEVDPENRQFEKSSEDRKKHLYTKVETEQRQDIDEEDSHLTELAALTGPLCDKEVTVLTEKLISPKSTSRCTGILGSSFIAQRFSLSPDSEVVPAPLSQSSCEGNLEMIALSEGPMGASAVTEPLTKSPSSQYTSEGTENTIPSEDPSSEEGGNSEDRADSTEIAVLTRRLCDREVAMLTRRPLSPQLMLRSTGTPRVSVVIAQGLGPSSVTSSSSRASSDGSSEAPQQLASASEVSAIQKAECPESDVESSTKCQSPLQSMSEATDAATASDEPSSEGSNGEEPGICDARPVSTNIAVLTGRLCDKEVAMFTRRPLSPQILTRDTGTPRASVVTTQCVSLSPEVLPITETVSEEHMEAVQESPSTHEESSASSVHVVQFSDGEGESIKCLSPPRSTPEGTETTKTSEAPSSEDGGSGQDLETFEARTDCSEIAVLTGPLCDKEVAMLTRRRLTPQLYTRDTGTPRASVVTAQVFRLSPEPVAIPPPISRTSSDANTEAMQGSASIRDVSEVHNVPFTEGPVECSTKWPPLLHSTPDETETSTDGDTCEASSEGSNDQELPEVKSDSTEREDSTLHISHKNLRKGTQRSISQHLSQQGAGTSTACVIPQESPAHEYVALQPPTSQSASEMENVSTGDRDEALSFVREIIAEHFPFCHEEEEHKRRCRAPLYSIPEETESGSEDETHSSHTSSEVLMETRTDSSDDATGSVFVYYDSFTTSRGRPPAPPCTHRAAGSPMDSSAVSGSFSPEDAIEAQSSIPQPPTSVGSRAAPCETMCEDFGMDEDSVVWSSLLSLLSAQPPTPQVEVPVRESQGAERGAGPGAPPPEELTVRLLEAAAAGDLEGVLRALVAGAAVDEPFGFGFGWRAQAGSGEADQPFGLGCRALQVAARGGHTSVVALLVRSGAGVNLADAHGRTALHEAAAWDRVACVAVLVREGAAVAQRDGQCSLTALHLAALHGSEGAAHALLAAGADPGALDALGRTALELARGEAVQRVLVVWQALRQPPWPVRLAQLPHGAHVHPAPLPQTYSAPQGHHAPHFHNVQYAQRSRDVRHVHQAPYAHATTNRPRRGRRQRGGKGRQRRHSI